MTRTRFVIVFNLKPTKELCLTDLNLRPHKVEEEDLYTINYIQLNQLENKASGKVPVHNDWVTKVTYIPQLRTGKAKLNSGLGLHLH